MNEQAASKNLHVWRNGPLAIADLAGPGSLRSAQLSSVAAGPFRLGKLQPQAELLEVAVSSCRYGAVCLLHVRRRLQEAVYSRNSTYINRDAISRIKRLMCPPPL